MTNLEQNIIKKKRGNPAWQKGGAAPNPGGRPKGIHQLIDAACKKYKLNLFDTLVEFASDTANNIKDRTTCINILLDRRYGKPLQTQDLTISSPEPISFFYLEPNEEDKSN
jgi:hypothetical protein